MLRETSSCTRLPSLTMADIALLLSTVESYIAKQAVKLESLESLVLEKEDAWRSAKDDKLEAKLALSLDIFGGQLSAATETLAALHQQKEILFLPQVRGLDDELCRLAHLQIEIQIVSSSCKTALHLFLAVQPLMFLHFCAT